MSMSRLYPLTITFRAGTQLSTERVQVADAAGLREAVELTPSPAVFSLSRPDGDAMLYLMRDGEKATLTTWSGDMANYLQSDQPVVDGEFIELGWDIYPSWMVVSNLEYALRAADEFIGRGGLAGWAKWRSEKMEF